MILPLGTLMSMADGGLNAAMNVGIPLMASWARLPVAGLVVLSYTAQGLSVAGGDPRPFQQFFPNLIRVIIVIWLVTNPGVYNYWVRGLLFSGAPDSVINAIAAGMGTTAVQIAGGGAAIVFDHIWSQINVVVGAVWQHARPWDVGAYLAGYATLITVGLELLVNALVYIGTDFLRGIMIILGPGIIMFAVTAFSREFAQRWLGKCVSLILMKVASVVILQILLTGDQYFMDQITNPIPATQSSVILIDQMQNLVGMVVWFCAGAFAMLSLTAIAYSIGTGIAVTATDLFAGYFLMRGAAGLLKGGAEALGRIPAYPSLSNMNIQLARQELAGGQRAIGQSARALPPPPPTPLIAR